MKKKPPFFSIIFIVLLVFGYLNLPLEWRRHKDIKRGQVLIENLQEYYQQNGRLPENTETGLLKQLGFTETAQGWQPSYRKSMDGNGYTLRYQDGFKPPYLVYHSEKKTWMLEKNTKPKP